MSNLQTYYHFKLDFQKMDQHTGGKWLIHGTKRRKDNQLQSLELTCRISDLIHGWKDWIWLGLEEIVYNWNIHKTRTCPGRFLLTMLVHTQAQCCLNVWRFHDIYCEY